jgi:type IV pilus assembly protein PilY1
MRLRNLRIIFVIAFGLALLDSPATTAGVPIPGGCNANDCLTNSAVAQRIQPTTVGTDDHGDVTFFASQSGQLPNVMFILDNSTSMLELPQNIAPFPNASFVSTGVTPNGTTTAGCHSNTFLEGRRDARNTGLAYSKLTTYAPLDPFYNADPTNFYNSTKYYKYMEWTASAPGGNAVATGSTGACSAMSSALNSGGTGVTQQQRCQQCLDEAGYYIKPGATGSSSDVSGGLILFKGNWLNFYPPKFLIARKTLTDFISAQTNSPTPVRIGLTTYDPNNVNALSQPSPTNGLQTNDGGAMISTGMIPDCSVTNWRSGSAPTQQSSLLTAVRAISWGSLSNGIATPLAETLFNVGQFFTGDNALYKTFLPGATGSPMTTQWIKSAFTAPTTGAKPLCVSCQVNAVVLITDGQSFGDNNVPYFLRQNTIGCTDCGTDENNGSANTLAQVANFLATTDLNASMTGIQDVITFVIGLGLSSPLLNEAAKYGKSGSALRADTAQDLSDAVSGAVINIVARSTAFSSTAIQTLEVGTGSTAYVPRFLPSSPADPIWEGHLFRFDLFNEFVANVDKNGDGKKDGVFLVDRDGDIVTEDDKGNFHKSICNAGVCVPGGPANPIWDAGGNSTIPGKTPQLGVAGSYANRNIYTGVWDSTNNVWTTIPFTGNISDPNFPKIRDSLGLNGTNACAMIQASMKTPIDPNYLSSTGTFDTDHCAKAVIDFTRGQNILNDSLTANGATAANRLRMLGDIFHSSPVVVDPPVDQFICSTGLHSQCLSTLYQYGLSTNGVTPIPTQMYTVGSGASTKQVDAYEKYWEDHETRQRIVVVGSNDGLIHAFDAGSPTTNPPTLNPAIGFRQVMYDSGGGGEVWAFVPPDQLPRLWLNMRDGHQMYMDGDIMVRDIWVDGRPNDKGTGTYSNAPLVKQDVEYHTVAIASERQGGTHFVALDVTDTTTPKMLWVYPPPCSPEEQQFGQTWGQFSPRPPPVGPVLLQTNNVAGPTNYGVTHTEERWAVMLNGGHDPYGDRGRMVAMLDAYTGTPLFKAAYNPASADPADPAKQMRFGFPATPALVDYGTGNDFQQDGFFDTAVLGDEGGQLWTIRFPTPGHINTGTGLVDNWTFGRAFEPKPSTTNDTRFHQPIYMIASTAIPDSDTRWLHAYVGTGDRSHIRSQGGGDCRPDDPMDCINLGCTVSAAVQLTNGTSQYNSTFASAAGSSVTAPAMTSPTQTQTSVSTNACNISGASLTMAVSACPATTSNFNQNASFSCTGSPLACTESPLSSPMPDTNRNVPTTTTGLNQFMSVAVLAGTTGTTPAPRSRRMNVPADADTYDTNRLSTADLIDVSSTTATTAAVTGNQAKSTDAGWKLSYATIDEKTVTSSTLLGGCVIWSSLIPTANTVGCASAGSSIAPFYQANPSTGAPNCAASFLDPNNMNNYVRSIQRNVISPPPEPSPAVAIGGGLMKLSTLEIQPGGQQVTQMTVSAGSELLKMVYSLPLTAEQHTCRHVDATKCK